MVFLPHVIRAEHEEDFRIHLTFNDGTEGSVDFEAWLDAGHAASMSYLARGRADRLDPARLLPGVRSVVAVALSYKPAADDPSWRGVAAYARGRDYHDVLRERLATLASVVTEQAGPETRARVAVDTSDEFIELFGVALLLALRDGGVPVAEVHRVRDELLDGFEDFNRRVADPAGFRLPNPVNSGEFRTPSGKAVFSANEFEWLDAG